MKIYTLEKLVEKNLDKTTKISGIYIWGVKIDDYHYVPIYVGKAKKIPQRIYEHLCAWKGGAYRIPKWEDISQEKKEWEFIHEPDRFIDFKKLMDNEDGQKTINNVISHFFCCWKELDDYQNYSRKGIQEMEDALANKFLAKHSLISPS